MPDEIQLEWTYTPADLFEERAELLIDGTVFAIDAGAVIGRSPFEGNPATDLHSFCNALHQRIDAVFLAAQALEHKAYTLSGPRNAVRFSSDGGRHPFLLAETLRYETALRRIDIRKVDAAGNVAVDTRRDRIGRRIALAQSAGEHIGDPAANSILRSYAAAVRDPGNELIHLYEIRDAVLRHLGGKEKTAAALNVSEDEREALDSIACDRPLLQGRHCGRFLGALQAATTEELSEARSIALKMIEAYLALVEKKPPERRFR